MQPTTTFRTLTIAALIALPLALTGCAQDEAEPKTETQSQDQQSAEIALDQGWAKAASGMSGVFGTLVNPTDEAVTLVSASSSRAGLVELHETTMVDGQMTMREIDGGFEIPADGTVELVPGEDHIMLMELDTELLPGEQLPLTLTFSNGFIVEMMLDVREYAGANETYGDLEHGDTDHGDTEEDH